VLGKLTTHRQYGSVASLTIVLSTVLLSACSESSTNSDPEPNPDPTYRLTTEFTGDNNALSVVDDNGIENLDETATQNDAVPTQLRLRPVANVAEQRWKFTRLDDGRYTISNQSIGDGYSIDVVNDGVLDRIQMAPTANVSGQFWTITLRSNGYCQLTNSFTGSEIALDIRSDGNQDEPMLAPVGDFSGQSWRFTLNNNSIELDENLIACSGV